MNWIEVMRDVRWRATLAAVALGAAAPALAADERAAADAPPAASGAPAAPAPTGAGAEAKRVVYVPETVKAQLREEIKQEILTQAKQEGWAAPNVVPGWVSRLKIGGDVRGRFERSLFGRNNASGGEFPDFNAINNGNPFDVNFVDVANERYLNVDQDRTRPRLRVRLGVDADVTEGFTAGLRLASGENASPVSTNQTLGSDFQRYQVWIDRAFVRWEPVRGDASGLAFSLGRFQNPFFTTELLWSDSVNTDGVAVQARKDVGGGLAPFVVAGAFPLETTLFNFPAERTQKLPSRDKWLGAGQVGLDWKLSPALRARVGGAFYYFSQVEGKLSGPCDTNLKGITCDTDNTRPLFAQKGNTYMALRRPSDAALQAEVSGTAPRYEFFGLAARFREVVATGRLEYAIARPVLLTVEGEYAHNAGFSAKQASGVALNNRDRCDASGNCAHYAGGANAYLGRVMFGSPEQDKQWSWSAHVALRRAESDALVDAFNDSDFGLGGTNLKGYVFGGSLGLADGVTTTARWMSANEIVGPTYRVDVLQVDLITRF
jgi:hypothetical protein